MILFAQQNEAEWQTIVSLIGGVVILVILMVVFGVFARYFRLWIQCVLTKASISIWDLLGMTFRKVNPAVIVRSKIMAVQAGLTEEMGITSRALEAHYLALGLVAYIVTLSPQRIILGGGVMDQDHLLRSIRKNTQELLNGYVNAAEILDDMDHYIVRPQLRGKAGVLGSIALAFSA